MLFDDFFKCASISAAIVETTNVDNQSHKGGTDTASVATAAFVVPELETAMQDYFELYKAACDVSERMQLGEVVDGAENLFLGLKSIYLKYLDIRSKYFSEPLISFGEIDMSNGDINTLSMQANRLIGEGLMNKDICSYEKGKWILCCCMH